VDPKTALIVVDTDIFVRDLRYSRDRESKTNRRFLETIRKQGNATTTIVNLLEICGILSFNLPAAKLKELFYYFPQHYGVDVLPVHSLEDSFPEIGIGILFERLSKKLSFGDALVASVIEKYIPGADVFVSWNAKHFQQMPFPCLTPTQFLKSKLYDR
jgi:predicted nucleic acid-binding protein